MRRHSRLASIALSGISLLAFTTSTSVAAPESGKRAGISVSEKTVDFGEKFGLGGKIPSGSTRVTVKFRPAGSKRWTKVQSVHTDRKGKYKTVLKASRSGSYRVVPTGGVASLPEQVSVRSQTVLHVSRHNATAGHKVLFRGLVKPGGRRKVKLVVRTAGQATESIKTVSGKNGSFSAQWEPSTAGGFTVRAYTAGNDRAHGSASVGRDVTVFRQAYASWYGPGLYGNPTACGGTLSSTSMIVANKYLPCGTKLTMRYGNRTVHVVVGDRGPYAAGREFDLAGAVKEKLGFPDLGYVLVSK